MILSAITDSLLRLLILLPFFAVARNANKNGSLIPVWYSILIYLVCNILLYVTTVFSCFGEQYNWTGKIAAFIVLVGCIYFVPGCDKKHSGFTLQMEWTGARPILLICSAYLLVRVLLYWRSSEASATIHPESALFQATMPGLQEELLFRGILMGLLNQVLVKPVWKFAGSSFGWAAVITSILFGLEHGISLGAGFGIHINFFNFIRTALEGFLFSLLVLNTKSIFPAVIYHNVLNLISNH